VLERTTTGRSIGLDAGVVATLTGSDRLRRHAPGLGADVGHRWRRLERKLARQQKGSKRRARTKSSLGRLRAREADGLKNWIEQTTTELVRDYDLIAIEDLRVKNMVRSAQGTVVAVSPAFTSKRCSACGHTEERNRESQAVFLCRACGHHDNADVNAAKNILAAGLAVTARRRDTPSGAR
jgi:transposase